MMGMSSECEREVEQRERVCRALLDNSIDPIALLDRDGTIRFVTDPISDLPDSRLPSSSAGPHSSKCIPTMTAGPQGVARGHRAPRGAGSGSKGPEPVIRTVRGAIPRGHWGSRLEIPTSARSSSTTATPRRTVAREAALEESERLHQSTFDDAPIGVAHTSLAGRFLHVNRWLCRVLGYSPEELTSLDFMTLTHPEEVEQDVEARHRLVRGELDCYRRESGIAEKTAALYP